MTDAKLSVAQDVHVLRVDHDEVDIQGAHRVPVYVKIDFYSW